MDRQQAATEIFKFAYFEEKTLPFVVAFSSCVGIRGTNYPLSYGNYCGIGRGSFDAPYCCNMWAENIQEFKRRNPDMTDVRVKLFGHVAVVIDERIPKEWRSSFCLNGYGGMKSSDLKALLEYCNQPLEGYLCGCEEDDQRPSVWGKGSLNSKMKTNTCSHCKREWETPW